MLSIEDNIIRITRGDDASIPVTITDEDGTAYEMQEGDKLTLTVRAIPDTESAELMKCESTTSTLVITHEDTDIPAGQYSYDLQLTRQNGEIHTLIGGESYGNVKNWKNFIVGGEVSE